MAFIWPLINNRIRPINNQKIYVENYDFEILSFLCTKPQSYFDCIHCLLALDNSIHIVTKYYDLLSEENTFFANKDDDRSKVLFMYVEV